MAVKSPIILRMSMYLSQELKQRMISALIISAVVACPIYFGGVWTYLLSFAAGALCAYEVTSCKQQSAYLIKAYAVAYVMMGSVAFALLRDEFGRLVVCFLIIATCFADTFAFLGGRAIGGPKLCPKISPKKTVSGLLCGIFCSVIASHGFSLSLDMDKPFRHVTLSAALALTAVVGDLFISFIKRKLGIKDFSNLIPGHGGLLDRLDSLFLSSIALYLTLRYL
ncbi:MAG: phosphatidate cytidylyltransferase [Holosporales bacterium]|jgi:phosphatidate cytidylyltransferase|nr:phosphatidate cytidylyltransferase [Holosporales bacterium]